MYCVLNCHNVAKHTELYFGSLQLNVTSAGNAGCFKKNCSMTFQALMCDEFFENVYV
jgi:hypothetical protein